MAESRQGKSDANAQIALVMSLRRKGISDVEVLRAMELTPRALFVEAPFIEQATWDMALPIACGQTISQPYVVAYMSELLKVEKNHKLLEVGTGSGYQAAVLSHMCRRLFTIEIHRQLLLAARVRFERLGLDNIVTRVGDGRKGWPEQAPFDRIIVTAAASEIPPALIEQLALGGRLGMPVGESRESQKIVVLDKTNRGLESEELMPVRFVPLRGGEDEENEDTG
jgi:protein-L-isoaspartate(D-aspartate) O-methyltransferase